MNTVAPSRATPSCACLHRHHPGQIELAWRPIDDRVAAHERGEWAEWSDPHCWKPRATVSLYRSDGYPHDAVASVQPPAGISRRWADRAHALDDPRRARAASASTPPSRGRRRGWRPGRGRPAQWRRGARRGWSQPARACPCPAFRRRRTARSAEAWRAAAAEADRRAARLHRTRGLRERRHASEGRGEVDGVTPSERAHHLEGSSVRAPHWRPSTLAPNSGGYSPPPPTSMPNRPRDTWSSEVVSGERHPPLGVTSPVGPARSPARNFLSHAIDI
jgi:hypothetical protein